MKWSRVWAMPSPWTFQIPPIAEFVHRHIQGCSVVIDPFCGTSTLASHRNDLGHGGIDALDYVQSLDVVADAVIFDPPYSTRQISECYKNIGRRVGTTDTQIAVLYAKVRDALAQKLRPGGVALSFGWNSMGFGMKWPTTEILLVAHGGIHNDTICVAQRKPTDHEVSPLFAEVIAKSEQRENP